MREERERVGRIDPRMKVELVDGVFEEVFRKLRGSELLRGICKEYFDGRLDCYWIIEGMFIYESERDMVMHMKIKSVFEEITSMYGEERVRKRRQSILCNRLL
jgi:hypothetical protein